MAAGVRVLLLVAFAVLATPSSAPAVVTMGAVSTYPVAVDVELDLTEKSHWQGIRPGCFAPHENFDVTYNLKLDSRPGAQAQIVPGIANVSPVSYGSSPSYGAKSSFRQWSSGNPWELETQYPDPDCGQAPAPPDWATSPTCKKINERVSATLLANDYDEAGKTGFNGDGIVLVTRTPKAKPTANGADMGASCYRTLHDIDPRGRHSLIEISLKSTVIEIPVPKMRDKLKALAKGSKKARPSFRLPVSVSGDCKAMRMRPTVGDDPDFSESSFSQPHQALGSFNGEPGKSACMISGTGSVTVRRAGAAVNTKAPFVLP